MSITRTITLAVALTMAATGTARAQFEDDEQPAPPPKTPAKAPDKAPEKAPEKAPDAAAPDKKKPAPAPKPPSPEDMKKAKEAYVEGQRLIDEDKDYVKAVVQFKLSYRLSRNPLLLYNIALALDESKQKTLAVFYFKKFLADAPAEAPNRDLATERLAVLEKESQGEDVAIDTTPPPVEDTKPAVEDKKPAVEDKKPVDAFQHVVVEEAPPGVPLDVTCFIPDAAKWQVNVFYRGQGENKFTSVAMRTRYTELVGRIPAAAMKGTSLQYYIEARDPSGKVVARSGRSTSPNLVFIDESARPRFYPDLDGNGPDGGVGAGAGGRFTGGGSMGGGGTGPIDQTSDFETKLKWGTTATAGGLLTLSIASYLIAANASSSLEGEAYQSNNDTTDCPMGPPCRTFDDDKKGLESRGHTFNTLSNVFFFTGVVAAGAAGYLWYRDLKRAKKDDKASTKSAGSGTSVFATPVLGRDFVGGGAVVRF